MDNTHLVEQVWLIYGKKLPSLISLSISLAISGLRASSSWMVIFDKSAYKIIKIHHSTAAGDLTQLLLLACNLQFMGAKNKAMSCGVMTTAQWKRLSLSITNIWTGSQFWHILWALWGSVPMNSSSRTNENWCAYLYNGWEPVHTIWTALWGALSSSHVVSQVSFVSNFSH